MTGNKLPFFEQYMYAIHASFFRHYLAAEQAVHRRDLIHYLFSRNSLHEVQGPDLSRPWGGEWQYARDPATALLS